jgi:hypothetical protein
MINVTGVFGRLLMMSIPRVLAVALLSSILGTGAVLAQATPPPSLAPGFAQTTAKHKTPEDRKMERRMKADCKKQARSQHLHFGKRRAFMKDCMSKMKT